MTSMVKMSTVAKEVAKEYASSLSGLTKNSKQMINMLSMVADENIRHAPIIVQASEEHLQKHQLRRMQVAGQEAAKILAAPKPMEPPVALTKSQMAMPVPAPVFNTSQNSGTVTVTVHEAAGAPAGPAARGSGSASLVPYGSGTWSLTP